MASFKAARADINISVDTDTSRRVAYASGDGTTSDEDRRQEQSWERDSSIEGATYPDQPQDTDYLQRLAGHTSLDFKLPCGGLAPSSTSIPVCEDQLGPETRHCNSGSTSGHEDFRLSGAITTTSTVPPKRRDTFTLATSTDDEVFGTIGATEVSKPPPRSLGTTAGICHSFSGDISWGQRKAESGITNRSNDSRVGHDSRVNLPPSVRVADGLKRRHGKRDNKNEHIWRASLSGSTRPPKQPSNSTDMRDRESVNMMSSTLQHVAWPSAWVNSSSVLTEEVDGITAGGREGGPGKDGVENTLALQHPSHRLEKLPGEDLASVLLSDHNFVSSKLSSAGNILERAQLLEKHPTQPFPDLPYGFTDLGRRLNVEHSQHGGGGGAHAPAVDVVVGGASREGGALEK